MGKNLILNANHFNQYWWLDQPQGVETVSNFKNTDIDNLINNIRQHSKFPVLHQRQIYFSSIRNISDRDL